MHPVAQQVIAAFAPKLLPTIDFTCTDCGLVFGIPTEEYRGQFDHPPAEPVCDACRERAEGCHACDGSGYVKSHPLQHSGDPRMPFCPVCKGDGHV